MVTRRGPSGRGQGDAAQRRVLPAEVEVDDLGVTGGRAQDQGGGGRVVRRGEHRARTDGSDEAGGAGGRGEVLGVAVVEAVADPTYVRPEVVGADASGVGGVRLGRAAGCRARRGVAVEGGRLGGRLVGRGAAGGRLLG